MLKKIIFFAFAAMLLCAYPASVQAAKPAKESGAQMVPETNAAYANAYKRLEGNSGLKGIGKPLNYTCEGAMSQGFSYKPDNKVLKQEDKEAYTKAIWNLCLEATSSAPYAKRFQDGKQIKVEHKTIGDAMNKAGDFNWHYTIGDVEYRISIYFKNDQLYLIILS